MVELVDLPAFGLDHLCVEPADSAGRAERSKHGTPLGLSDLSGLLALISQVNDRLPDGWGRR